ncbi:MAG: GNAT family N-acetyltransferase [Cyanobacteria bacterium P01_G01_bin.67]
MNIIRQIEFDIDPKVQQKIIELRNICLTQSQTRSYFKQLPHFRYLVFTEDQLVGHMGVDHRAIKVGDCVVTIFGVIDLCVRPSYRRQGIATQCLTLLTELAQEKLIDFLFLVSQHDSVYLNNGFQAVSQECSWLGIEEHQNCGVLTETIKESFMVKQTGDKLWVNAPIDLLGYMF